MNYTITVTNAQDASYTDAHVTDDLSGVLDDAVYKKLLGLLGLLAAFKRPRAQDDAATIPGSPPPSPLLWTTR